MTSPIGSFSVADETTDRKKILNYLLASISTPGIFPPVNEGNASYVEGSVIASLDIPALIDKCREIVDRDEDIVLDVIMVQEGIIL